MLTDSKSKKSSKSETSKSSKITSAAEQSDSKRNSNGPTACTVLVLSVMLFVLIIMIIIIGQLGFHTKEELEGSHSSIVPAEGRHVSEHPCSAKECVNYASELLNTIDFSMDPCDDFHSMVCKNIHKTSSEYNVHDEILKLLVEKCDSRDYSFIFNKLWPEDLTELLIDMSKTTPNNLGIFGLQHSYDSTFKLYIGRAPQPKSREESRKQIEDVQNRVRYASHIAEEEINKILDFEDRLRHIPSNNYKSLLTISEIEQILPAISWNTFVKGLVGNFMTTDTLRKNTYVLESDYFKNLSKIIAQTNQKVLHNYLKYRWIRNIAGDANSKNQCDQYIYTLSRIFDTVAHQKSYDLMMEVINNMKEMLQQAVLNNDWMGISARNSTGTMLKNLQFKILDGFETFRDEIPDIDRNSNYFEILLKLLEWKNTKAFQSLAMEIPHVVLHQWAFYSKKDNTILISPRLLKYPYASRKFPAYLRYAMLSSLVLPHVINAIGDSGVVDYAEGSIITNWPKNSREHYKRIIKCYEDNNVDSSLLTSINTGIRTYNESTGDYVQITGFETYSDIQMFFIGLVKSRCDFDDVKVNTVLHHHWNFKRAFNCSVTNHPEYIENISDKCEPLI